MITTDPKRHQGLWVSTLYFAEGFPYTVVNLMSIIFLKDLGASNELVGLTSFFYLPWVFKGLWGPLVDLYSTKRHWILVTEAINSFLLVILSFSILFSSGFTNTIIILAVMALFAATHDTAVDGFYLNVLNKTQQVLYIGLQSTAYKVAWLIGEGGLVFLAGYLAVEKLEPITSYGNSYFSIFNSFLSIHPLRFGWFSAFFVAAVMYGLVCLFHFCYLPYPHTVKSKQNLQSNFFQPFKSYFAQQRIGWIVAYTLTFRLGDALMLKITPLFLMDRLEKGGLAIPTTQVGILYGTVGIIFLLLGGVLGSYLIAKYGLEKWLWPTAVLQNSAIGLYWILAVYKPSLSWVYVVNSFEQLSYGIGVSAYTAFLMSRVRSEFAASHYAITTAFMALGIFLPGLFSGYLQSWVGYETYFLISLFLALPGLAIIFFLPLEQNVTNNLVALNE